MVAAMASTFALSRRSLFFIPPSIIALWAMVDVNRSSYITTGICGISFFRRFTKGVM